MPSQEAKSNRRIRWIGSLVIGWTKSTLRHTPQFWRSTKREHSTGGNIMMEQGIPMTTEPGGWIFDQTSPQTLELAAGQTIYIIIHAWEQDGTFGIRVMQQ